MAHTHPVRRSELVLGALQAGVEPHLHVPRLHLLHRHLAVSVQINQRENHLLSHARLPERLRRDFTSGTLRTHSAQNPPAGPVHAALVPISTTVTPAVVSGTSRGSNSPATYPSARPLPPGSHACGAAPRRVVRAHMPRTVLHGYITRQLCLTPAHSPSNSTT